MATFRVELKLVKRNDEDDSLHSAVDIFMDVPADEKLERFKLKALRHLGVRARRPDYLEHCVFICGSTKRLRNEDNDKTCAEAGLSDHAVVRVLLMFPQDAKSSD